MLMIGLWKCINRVVQTLKESVVDKRIKTSVLVVRENETENTASRETDQYQVQR